MPFDLNSGIVPTIYRELFEMFNNYGFERLTVTIFTSLFESTILTKAVLNQIWFAVTSKNNINTRDEFYKCLALMALAQQNKSIDEKLLDNFINRELPVPKIDSRTELEDRLVRLLRTDQRKSTLCYRYSELCALDTIQVDLVPERKGAIIRHFEYDITSQRHRNRVSRRYNDFVALDELLNQKYLYRIIPPLPPKKSVNVDKEFIEDRRQGLKRYLQILTRHPILCESDILKFFLTFQGSSNGENMKATYKNFADEFQTELRTSTDLGRERMTRDPDGIRMFRTSETHLTYLLQQFQTMRTCLKSINERRTKNANDFTQIEQNLQILSSDSSTIDRWATGPNDYWPAIQQGLSALPTEINALSERLINQSKRDDQVISEHMDMLIDLLQGYKDLCKRFDEALQFEQKAIQKAANQQRRSSNSTIDLSSTASPKNEMTLEMIEKRNTFALKSIQNETQLIYANLEAFVYILNNLGNSEYQGSTELNNVWKSFAYKVSQLGQNYVNKSSIYRKS